MSTLPPALRKLSLPIIGSPLFIISNPKLVIEQCKAGIVGSMPALNARPASQLDEWLHEITETLAAYNRANPDKPAYIMAGSGEVVTYRELNDRSNQGAQLFRSLGLERGKRTGLCQSLDVQLRKIHAPHQVGEVHEAATARLQLAADLNQPLGAL